MRRRRCATACIAAAGIAGTLLLALTSFAAPPTRPPRPRPAAGNATATRGRARARRAPPRAPPPPPAKPAARGAAKDAAELSETRRARNREHARRSRCRKKLIIESLQQSLTAYQAENERLRQFVRAKLGEAEAAPRLEWCEARSKGEATDTDLKADEDKAERAIPLPRPPKTQPKRLRGAAASRGTRSRNFIGPAPLLGPR